MDSKILRWRCIGDSALVGLVMFLGGLLVSTPAVAARDNFADPCQQPFLGRACPANSRHHIFFFGGSMSDSAIYWTNRTRSASYNKVSGWTTASTTHHDSADLHLLYTPNGFPDPGLVGLYTCQTTGSSGSCDHAHVRYNSAYWNSFSGSERWGLTCHEIGHSVGLTHPLDAGQPNDVNTCNCLVQGVSNAAQSPYLGSHNSWHMTSESFYN